MAEDLAVPFDRRENHPAALKFDKYSVSRKELFRANFQKEWLLMRYTLRVVPSGAHFWALKVLWK